MAHKRMGSGDANTLARNLQGPQNTESSPVTSSENGVQIHRSGSLTSMETTTPQMPGASPTPLAPITCSELSGLLARVTVTKLPSTPSGLVGLLKVLTVLINALTCLQARIQAGLLEARRDEAKATGHSLRPVRGAVTQEIGLACRLSPYKASEHLKRSLTLPTRLPSTWDQWATGEISAERASMVARETRPLDPDTAGHVDATVAPGLGKHSKKAAENLVRRTVTDADPDAAAERARKALEDRYASARPAGDGMITFNALIPGLEGQAIWTGLEQRATLIRGTGDSRSKEQIKADLTVEALISYLTYLADTDVSPGPKTPRPGVQIQLVMTDAALFGYSNTTARAHGLGPVPAPLARAWAHDAIQDERAELIRLYTQPGTGRLVAMDSTRRTFPKSLARYVTTRDDLCRTPWCGAPIRHIDHVTPHASGGLTALTNAQGLCIQCNQHKDGPGWTHQSEPDAAGIVSITTPTGDVYTTTPTPLPHEIPA